MIDQGALDMYELPTYTDSLADLPLSVIKYRLKRAKKGEPVLKHRNVLKRRQGRVTLPRSSAFWNVLAGVINGDKTEEEIANYYLVDADSVRKLRGRLEEFGARLGDGPKGRDVHHGDASKECGDQKDSDPAKYVSCQAAPAAFLLLALPVPSVA